MWYWTKPKNKRTQRQHMEVAVLKTQNIQELKMKLEQQLANIATSSGGSIPGRILATIDTRTSGGGSTTSTVTKEEMMQMLAKFKQTSNQVNVPKSNHQEQKELEKKRRKVSMERIVSKMTWEEGND